MAGRSRKLPSGRGAAGPQSPGPIYPIIMRVTYTNGQTDEIGLMSYVIENGFVVCMRILPQTLEQETEYVPIASLLRFSFREPFRPGSQGPSPSPSLGNRQISSPPPPTPPPPAAPAAPVEYNARTGLKSIVTPAGEPFSQVVDEQGQLSVVAAGMLS